MAKKGDMARGNNKEQRYKNVLPTVSSSVKLIRSVQGSGIGFEFSFGVGLGKPLDVLLRNLNFVL